MTHKANLPDYLDNYLKDIETSLNAGKHLTPLQEPQDFFKYFEEMKFDENGNIKKNDYSNIGILISGLVALTYYNKDKTQLEKKTYSQILDEIILKPAGIDYLSATPPEENGLFSDYKPQAYICGSPAGGYWTNAYFMKKFADFICDKFSNKSFEQAISNYGQEFYDQESQTIHHRGEIVIASNSSSFFSVHIPSKTACIMASNSDYSGFTGQQVSNIIASEFKNKKIDFAKPSGSVEKTSTTESKNQCAKR